MDSEFFETVTSGEELFVKLRKGTLPEEELLPEFEAEIEALIHQHECKIISIDLTGVPIIASSVLACFIRIKKLGVSVELHNPSTEIKHYLQVTRLDELLRVRNGTQ